MYCLIYDFQISSQSIGGPPWTCSPSPAHLRNRPKNTAVHASPFSSTQDLVKKWKKRHSWRTGGEAWGQRDCTADRVLACKWWPGSSPQHPPAHLSTARSGPCAEQEGAQSTAWSGPLQSRRALRGPPGVASCRAGGRSEHRQGYFVMKER